MDFQGTEMSGFRNSKHSIALVCVVLKYFNARCVTGE